MTERYRCVKCKHEWQAYPGGATCPQCRHMYVEWLTYGKKEKE